ncbi:hypothetical protein [Chamaesiphon minutus]|uniref:hypothetical protein n=1 Tax=Chamaesiphon minutus TaxID=1173032 RepID=UPI0003042E46|nr:hypothetical protein [Chamaesiphon minutus]
MSVRGRKNNTQSSPVDRDMFDKLNVTVDVRHIFGELLEYRSPNVPSSKNCNN